MENSGFTSLDVEALPLPTDQAKIKQWTTWLSGLYQAKKSQSITQLWWQHFVRLTYVPYQISVSFFMHLFPESFLLAAASVLADRVIRTNTIYPDMMFPNSYLKSLIKADWFSFFLQLTSGSSLLFCYWNFSVSFSITGKYLVQIYQSIQNGNSNNKMLHKHNKQQDSG